MFKQNKAKTITVIKAKDTKLRPRLNGSQRLKECGLILGLLVAILMMVALFSFNPADPSWSQTSWGGTVHNAGGYLGSWLADTLFFTFGVFAYPLPFIILGASWAFFRSRDDEDRIDFLLWATRLLGLTIMLLTSCGLADINFDDIWYFSSGGVLGDVITSFATPALNILGSTLVFMFLWGAGFTLLTGISWLTIVENLGQAALRFMQRLFNRTRQSENVTLSATQYNHTELNNLDIQGIDHQELSLKSHSERMNVDEEPIESIDDHPNDSHKKKSPRFNIHFPRKGERKTGDNKTAPQMSISDDEVIVPSIATMDDDIEDPLFSAPSASRPSLHRNSQVQSTSSNSTASHSDVAAPSEFTETQDRYHNPNATIAELDQKAESMGDFVEQDASVNTQASTKTAGEQTAHTTNQYASGSYIEEEVHPNLPSSDKTKVDGDDELKASFTHREYPPEIASTQPSSAALDETSAVADSAVDPMPNEALQAEEDSLSIDAPWAKPANADHVQVNIHTEEDTDSELSDPDTTAFQNMVTAAQTNALASQNPFLIQNDANLPVPTSPMPTLELLYHPEKRESHIDRDALEQIARLVESKLADYKIEARVVDIFPGPVITRFELDLAPGVKVSRISGLSMDLARSLSAMAVRVVEVIPGKPYVGLELPNMSRETVYLSDVISSDQFQNNKSPTAVVLGQDIAGEAVVADLAKMPHVLVAGTTGSGKSVGVNVMILSILYKATPEDVRFIMIDPKMLELSIYEGIPHLLSEVVTDMKDASNALRWCVGEMERRYKLLSAVGVRNLKGYNEKLKMAAEAGHPIHDPLWQPGDSMDEMPPLLEKLPSIVVIVDEFADLIMVVGKKVEELIARLAQKARAAGIHLVLATQRPSVDVITGLIKANIPTRVAFTVSTKTDSRTILDQGGAESLLGMGDMLYLPPGSNHTVRVHGAFASDDDVHAVVNDWKARGKPVYIDEIVHGEPTAESLLPGEQLEGEEDADPLYDQVVEFVTESRRGSVSGVQRRFKIGYNRAARIVEQLEAQGVVSSPGHNGNREVIAPPPIKQFD